MNRPDKRNAINPAIVFEMVEVLDALEADERAQVVVITGAGDAFSSGQDLKEYFREPDAGPPIERERLYRANADWQWRRLMFYPKPTIAMVNGWCFGGAFQVLLGCDLAVADEEAKFGLSEINWGIIPAGIVTKSVAMALAQRHALYYIMTGDNFDGKRAAEIGLVNFAVPKAELQGPHARAGQKADGEESLRDARGQDRLSSRPPHVVGVLARLSDGQVRPDQVPRSGKGRPEGHVAVPRRQDLPAGAQRL